DACSVKPLRGGAGKQHRVAAPWPIALRAAQTRFHGVASDVAERGDQVHIVLDAFRAIAALEHVADGSMPRVEFLRVRRVEALHALAEIRMWGLYEQVHVIVHQAIGKTSPATAANDATKRLQIDAAIPVV